MVNVTEMQQKQLWLQRVSVNVENLWRCAGVYEAIDENKENDEFDPWAYFFKKVSEETDKYQQLQSDWIDNNRPQVEEHEIVS